MSVKRCYERTDIQPIVATGGVRLAYSPDECVRLIKQYLDNPQLDSEGRRKIRLEQCGPLDGHAGDRIAQLLCGESDRLRQ